MLIEPEVIPSSLWCDLCNILEQPEHFKSPVRFSEILYIFLGLFLFVSISNSMWLKLTNYNEFFFKEAPTGVSEESSQGQLESTAQGRESLRLHLDLSSIHFPRSLPRKCLCSKTLLNVSLGADSETAVDFGEQETLDNMSLTLEERGEIYIQNILWNLIITDSYHHIHMI